MSRTFACGDRVEVFMGGAWRWGTLAAAFHDGVDSAGHPIGPDAQVMFDEPPGTVAFVPRSCTVRLLPR